MLEYNEYLRRRSTPPSGLSQIINEVRGRWRMKLALRGVAWAAGVSVVLFLVAAYAMEWARFTPASIIGARVLLAAAILASIYYFLVRPLRCHVTDEQVALYLEEHEPSLQATLVTAVEASREQANSESAVLIRRLIEQALETCGSTNAARRVEEQPLRRWGAALAGLTLAAFLIVVLGPAFVRNA